jgi:serine/threonine protein phosphatase PrpC
LRIEYADVSLVGGRAENQDRVTIAVAEHAALLVVADGMGGYADGAHAAEVTRQVVLDAFGRAPQPLFDPMGFFHLILGRAHEEVVKLGGSLPIDRRPRATCALCLVQQGASWWAHVGDSRIYHIRGGALLERSRDHSHVEGLVREGLITAEQAQIHPQRNFVECCVGGVSILPDMAISRRRPLESGDVLLVCSDGLWGPLKDDELAKALGSGKPLREALQGLADSAVSRNGAASDNASGAVLRWLGEPRGRSGRHEIRERS